MTRIFRLLSLFVAMLLCAVACRSAGEDAARSALAAEVTSLIEEAEQELSEQNFEKAMEKALRALEISKTREGGGSFRRSTGFACYNRHRHHVDQRCGRLGEGC